MLDLVNYYIYSVKNESAIDEYVYSRAKLNAKDYFYLPRPEKWLSKYGKYKNLLKLLSVVFSLGWILGLNILYFFKEAVNFLNLSIRTQKNSTLEIDNFKNIALGFSSKSYELIKESTVNLDSLLWITLYWVKFEEIHKPKNFISIFQLAKWTDYIYAFVLSIFSSYYYVIKNFNGGSLQTYTAYRWFFVFRCLMRIDADKYYTSEHFDRWAVLLDLLIQTKKNRNRKKYSLGIVQHGSVLNSVSVSQDEIPDLPIKLIYKLKNVSSIFVYDETSEKIFLKSILDYNPQQEEQIEVKYFKPTVILREVNHGKTFSVLLVGHALCEKFHLSFLHELIKRRDDVAVFYKPHPSSIYSQELLDQQWTFIKDKAFFPKVNCLLAYPSTLVKEYESHLIPTILHNLNVDEREANDYVSKITNKLKEHRE